MPDRERVRAEAANWCARMHGAHAEVERPAFERWLAESALNRQIFSEMDELLRFGRLADRNQGMISQSNIRKQNRSTSRRKASAWAAVAACLLVSSALVVTSKPWLAANSNRDAAKLADQAVLSTSDIERRTFALSDGSRMILDRGSRVIVTMDANSRELHLERGRARFDVVHDGRPFTVGAGTSVVKALGTIFDVSIRSDRSVEVALLRGSIDVTTVAAKKGRTSKILKAGESILLGPTGIVALPSATTLHPNNLWPEGLITFNGAKLGDVIGQANLNSSTKLIIAEPDLANRPIFGTLRIDNPEALARVLAQSEKLAITRKPSRIELSEQ